MDGFDSATGGEMAKQDDHEGKYALRVAGGVRHGVQEFAAFLFEQMGIKRSYRTVENWMKASPTLEPEMRRMVAIALTKTTGRPVTEQELRTCGVLAGPADRSMPVAEPAKPRRPISYPPSSGGEEQRHLIAAIRGSVLGSGLPYADDLEELIRRFSSMSSAQRAEILEQARRLTKGSD